MADGTFSQALLLSSYTDLRGPVGGLGNAGLHPILQTARIPLSDFAGADLTQVRGVRFSFDGTATGAIYLANVRLSTLTGLGTGPGAVAAANFATIPDFSQALPTVASRSSANRIVAVRSVASGVALGNQAGVEIQVTSDEPFPVRDELAVLSINGVQTAMSRYPENGDTYTLIFTLTPEQFAQVSTGDPVTVQYGFGESNDRWSFGPLDKGLLSHGN